MKNSEVNFFEYIGAEEQNLITSIVNFKSELELFLNLDKIYKEPLKRMQVSEEESIIPTLYYFVHFYLYFSVSCFLRCHISECLAAVRKAIDASLSAYKIILEPNTAEQYLNRDKYFLRIKDNIQRDIKGDSSKYPLAHSLIKMHDLCSEYGSHADFSTFSDRLLIKKDEIMFHYFQISRSIENNKFYLLVSLYVYLLIFLIFKIFIDSKLKIIDPVWEMEIQNLQSKLEELANRYRPSKRRK